jgi:Fic family protein
MTYTTYLDSSGSSGLGGKILLLGVANDPLVALLAEVEENRDTVASQVFCTTLWRSRVSTRFNSQLPARPESVAAVLKVLSQNDELMVKDIARLGRLTQSQVRVALEELVASGTVVVRKLRRPRITLYRMRI